MTGNKEVVNIEGGPGDRPVVIHCEAESTVTVNVNVCNYTYTYPDWFDRSAFLALVEAIGRRGQ